MDDKLEKFVSRSLRQRRLNAGLSLDEMSQLTGISLDDLSKFEENSSGMGMTNLQLVTEALDIDVLAFFSGYVPDAESTSGNLAKSGLSDIV